MSYVTNNFSDHARADYEYQYTRHDHLCQCQGCSGEEPYDEPESDINGEEMNIQIRCPKCKRVWPTVIYKESLELYTPNGDGTYTDIYEQWCAECLQKA